MTKGFLSGAAWSAVGAACGIGIPFAALILFSHLLGPAQASLVILAVATAETMKALAPQGLYEALMGAPERIEDRAPTAAFMLAASAAVLLLLYAGVLEAVGRGYPDFAAHRWLLLSVGLKLVFDLLLLQPQAVLALRQDYRRLGVRSLVANTTALACGVLLAAKVSALAGFALYYPIQAASGFALVAFGSGAARRPRWDRLAARALWAQGLPASVVWSSALAQAYLDQFLLAWLLQPAGLAFYNLGKRLEGAMVAVASAFAGTLFQPMFTGPPAGRRIGLERGITLITAVCGLPAITFACNAGRAVELVFGPHWHDAAAPAAVLAVSGFLRAVGGVHGALLTVSGRNGPLLRASLAATVVGIGLAVAGSLYGALGCAVGVAVKDVLLTGWQAMLTRHDVAAPVRLHLLCLVLPTTAMAAAAAWSTITLGSFLHLPTFVVLAGSGLAATAAGGLALLPHWRTLLR